MESLGGLLLLDINFQRNKERSQHYILNHTTLRDATLQILIDSCYVKQKTDLTGKRHDHNLQ